MVPICVHTQAQWTDFTRFHLLDRKAADMDSPQKIGIREFRAHLSEVIAADRPMAVTRHGQTVGVFIPTRPPVTDEVLARLQVAAAAFAQQMAEAGVAEETLVAEFKAARQAARAKRAQAA
jgi:antitoxin (DNA-binding transcriptional repressor) of toxin-antitoxin stability system